MMIDGLTTAGRSRQSDTSKDAGSVLAGSTQGRTRVSAALAVQAWSVDWFFYGDPPTGLPLRLALELMAVPDAYGARRGRLCALYQLTLKEVPAGFGLSWLKHNRPPTRRSAEQRAAQRLGNLKRRLQAKAPLFADMFLERELSARPDYFAGAKDTAFRDQADADTAALYDRLLAGDMGLTIYHRWWPADDGLGAA